MVQLRQVVSRALLAAAFTSSWWQPAGGASLRDISKLFYYFNDAADTSVGGFPTDTDLQTLMNDVLTLANAGVSAASDALAGEGPAERLMDSLFMSPSTSNLKTIQARYQGVVKYLTSKSVTLNNNNFNAKRPFLFYGDGWRIRQDMQTELRTADNNVIPKADGSGNMLIGDDTAMVDYQKSALKLAQQAAVAAGQTAADAPEQYPYWSVDAAVYTFDKKYGDSPTDGVFAADAGIAFTIVDSEKGIVNLGPKAMEGGRLHSVTVTAASNDLFEDHTPPSDAITAISDVVPQATALFHELFHLVWGDDLMYPSIGEEYHFQRMTGYESRRSGQKQFTKKYAMQNPQNYVYAA
jgi:hypothetical protein